MRVVAARASSCRDAVNRLFVPFLWQCRQNFHAQFPAVLRQGACCGPRVMPLRIVFCVQDRLDAEPRARVLLYSSKQIAPSEAKKCGRTKKNEKGR
jgi:hypothetical protein